MKHLVSLAALSAVSVIALSSVAAPAQAHEGGREGGPGHHYGDGSHGHHGPWNSRASRVTLTEDVTAILDSYAVEIEAEDGAHVGRDRDDLIVLSLGQGRRGHRGDWDSDKDERGGTKNDSSGTITFSGAGSTTWTDFEVDKDDESVVITAEVDGVEDVPVLTLVRDEEADDDDDNDVEGWHHRGGSRGWDSAELLLTASSAAALDAVVGADEFAAGDVFATTGGCGR